MISTHEKYIRKPNTKISAKLKKYFHLQESHLGSVWQYSVSWYRDPTELDNIVLVRSRPRHAAASLDIAAWTNYEHAAAGGHQEPVALYVQVCRDGR